MRWEKAEIPIEGKPNEYLAIRYGTNEYAEYKIKAPHLHLRMLLMK